MKDDQIDVHATNENAVVRAMREVDVALERPGFYGTIRLEFAVQRNVIRNVAVDVRETHKIEPIASHRNGN